MTKFDVKEFLEDNPKPWLVVNDDFGGRIRDSKRLQIYAKALLAYTEYLEAEVERLKVENKQLGDDLRATEFNRRALISGYEKIRTSLREQRDKLKAEAALNAEALEVGRLVLRLPELFKRMPDPLRVELNCFYDKCDPISWEIAVVSDYCTQRSGTHDTALEVLRTEFMEVKDEFN